MRKLLILGLILLAVPTAAYSAKSPPANGTLSIREGRGVVTLNAKGSFTGRVRGKLTVTDPTPNDSKHAIVYGASKTTFRGLKTTIYQGRNVRFRLIGARYRIRVEGKAIFLSAIGRGTGTIDGAGNTQANIFYDGVLSLNDEPYHSLPDDFTEFRLAAPTPS